MKVWTCSIDGVTQEVASDMDIAYMWLKKQREHVLQDPGLEVCGKIFPGMTSFHAEFEDHLTIIYLIAPHRVRSTRGQMQEVA